MDMYRDRLPQLLDKLYITDGGLETTLIFHDGWALNHFAAIELLKEEAGYVHLAAYFRQYLKLAVSHELGFVLESPTWRASPDWGSKLGLTIHELAQLNHRAIDLLHAIREEYDSAQTPIIISPVVTVTGHRLS